MFDFLREICDNIKAEFDLATANPSPELCASVRRAINNKDSDLCAEFEDSTSWLGHGRILGDMEAKGLSVETPINVIIATLNWPEDQIRETVEAEKVVLFLRKKMYEDEQIKRIGKIAMALQKNNGDVAIVTNLLGCDVESVNAVIQLMNEYAATQGGSVVWQAQVTEEKKEEKKTTSSSKSTKKASASTKKEPEMVKPFTVPVTAGAK